MVLASSSGLRLEQLQVSLKSIVPVLSRDWLVLVVGLADRSRIVAGRCRGTQRLADSRTSVEIVAVKPQLFQFLDQPLEGDERLSAVIVRVHGSVTLDSAKLIAESR